jgi:zinc protease
MAQNKAAPAGFSYRKSAGGIDEYCLLKNGLTLLLMEDHTMPVVNVMVTYCVGSRNEALGYTGATHILEHLMFKGSKHFNTKNGKAVWHLLEARGAKVNATTWNDRTNYYALLPREYIDDALAIEADRMRTAFIREKDRISEMTVVRNEFERGENNPLDVLSKNIWATAYQAHPYHHDTIGWRADIENVPIKRLKQFYDTFYWPNNATVSIIGDFDRKNVFEKVRQHFGIHPPSPQTIPEMYTTEPKQEGMRRVIVSRRGQTKAIGVAHKSPEGLHPDTYPLIVLATILGAGKSSRLHRALVDRGYVTELFPWAIPFKDNGLFIMYAFMTPGTDHTLVENIILENYRDIKKKGIPQRELEKAKAIIMAETAFERDGAYAMAGALNEAIAIGDWTFYAHFSKQIQAVTGDDVLRVARQYLVDDQSTVGYFAPRTHKAETA